MNQAPVVDVMVSFVHVDTCGICDGAGDGGLAGPPLLLAVRSQTRHRRLWNDTGAQPIVATALCVVLAVRLDHGHG